MDSIESFFHITSSLCYYVANNLFNQNGDVILKVTVSDSVWTVGHQPEYLDW